MRARSALVASGVPCELREVVLRDKPQALLDASPKATVPVLVTTDGTVIDQSLDIMLWALRQNDPLVWLPAAPDDMAALLSLIAECDGAFKHHLDRYKYPQRYDDADPNMHRSEAGLWLNQLESSLARTPFLFGSNPTMGDAATAPFVRQFAHTDLDWFSAQPWPYLQAWLQRWLQSALFARVMEKVEPWAPGRAPVFFP